MVKMRPIFFVGKSKNKRGIKMKEIFADLHVHIGRSENRKAN